MKVTSNVILSVMSANERPSADGKTMYYNLAIMQNGEVANVSCDKTVYDDVSAVLEPDTIKKFRFQMATDLTYKSVKLTALLPDNDNSPKIGGGNFDNAEKPTDNKTDNKADGKNANK